MEKAGQRLPSTQTRVGHAGGSSKDHQQSITKQNKDIGNRQTLSAQAIDDIAATGSDGSQDTQSRTSY